VEFEIAEELQKSTGQDWDLPLRVGPAGLHSSVILKKLLWYRWIAGKYNRYFVLREQTEREALIKTIETLEIRADRCRLRVEDRKRSTRSFPLPIFKILEVGGLYAAFRWWEWRVL